MSLPEKGYERLWQILTAAHDRAALGKGKDRHATGEPFESQPICQLVRTHGHGFTRGQAEKKIREASRLLKRVQQIAELLDAINYLAADIIVLQEEMEAEVRRREAGRTKQIADKTQSS